MESVTCRHGPSRFFDRPDGHRQCYKMTEDLLPVIRENFFRYMRQEYSIITYRIKKEREKLSRRKAQLCNHRRTSPESREIQSKPMTNWIKNGSIVISIGKQKKL